MVSNQHVMCELIDAPAIAVQREQHQAVNQLRLRFMNKLTA
jgi:hypothetical protein